MPGSAGPGGGLAVRFLNPAAFFLISVAYKLAWTAISSLLSQFSRDYGPQVLLQLNVAYFLPSIPVLMLQTLLNDAMDRKMGGPARGAVMRFAIGLGGLVFLTGNFPRLASSHTRLLGTTTAVGMSYGMAFGTSYQLASRFPPINTVMLTTGFVSSGPIVLALDLALKRGPFYTEEGLVSLFTAVAWVTSAGLVAAVLLVFGNRRTISAGAQVQKKGANYGGNGHYQAAKGGRTAAGGRMDMGSGGDYGMYSHHSSAAVRHRSDATDMNGHWGGHGGSGGGYGGHHAMTLDMLEGGHYDSSSGSTMAVGGHDPYGSSYSAHDSYDASKQHKAELPLWAIAWRISPAMLSILLSVGTSMLVFPFFTYMKSTGLLGVRLAQVLFYVRLVGDVLGRCVPRRMQASTVRGLMFWAAVKTAMVPLIFSSIFTPTATGGDVGAVLLVAVFWVLSGYLNTCSYLVAPTLVAPSLKARASGLMTVAFQSSCFLALILAAGIQHASFPAAAAAMGAGVHGAAAGAGGAHGGLGHWVGSMAASVTGGIGRHLHDSLGVGHGPEGLPPPAVLEAPLPRLPDPNVHAPDPIPGGYHGDAHGHGDEHAHGDAHAGDDHHGGDHHWEEGHGHGHEGDHHGQHHGHGFDYSYQYHNDGHHPHPYDHHYEDGHHGAHHEDLHGQHHYDASHHEDLHGSHHEDLHGEHHEELPHELH